ncbi:unnamed protein product [Triticum turgidum subsp. durum]|uniref:Uncharacterized protein n=1 Tax=Triticum turgidum subsp. durum TaxID=4567 RepID=A0A9R0S232_TRITD|nr:unnamed protein product [Triticum turgidum subsp. durum]
MPKHTMGGRADAGADAMVHEASKRCAKLHMEKPLPANEGSSRQQGGRDVIDHVQAPVQVSPTLEQVAPFMWAPVTALAPQTEQVSPLPWVTPPVPEPVVAGDVNKDDVTPLAPLPEQVVAPQPQPGVHLPRMLPSLPPPVVVADENEEEVLSDDVDSDQETQRIYRRQKVRELNSGVLEKRIRPRIRRGATDALTATS